MAVYSDAAITGRVQGDTEFRDWIERIHDAIVGAGLVQTADTGQIDRATVSAPGASNTVAGYEVFRFDDTEQGNLPIYVKVEYGTGFVSGADARPSLWLTVGSSVDGAGTIGGQKSVRQQTASSGTATASAVGVFASCDDGYFVLQFADDATSTRPIIWWIERWPDADGVPTDDGFMVYVYSGGAGEQGWSVPASGTVKTHTDQPFFMLPSADTTSEFMQTTRITGMLAAAVTLPEGMSGVLRGMAFIYSSTMLQSPFTALAASGDFLGVRRPGMGAADVESYRLSGITATVSIPGSTVRPCLRWPGQALDATLNFDWIPEPGSGGGGGGCSPPATGQHWPRGNP